MARGGASFGSNLQQTNDFLFAVHPNKSSRTKKRPRQRLRVSLDNFWPQEWDFDEYVSSTDLQTKHALLGLTRALDEELREHNIRVGSVSPAGVYTDMMKNRTDLDHCYFMYEDVV